MRFDPLTIRTFTDVELFTTSSETTARDWDTCGNGTVRIDFMACDESVTRGWGKLIFHNELTDFLNTFIHPNMPIHPLEDEPARLTFTTVGDNGERKMYSIRLVSERNALRLWYAVNVMKFAAKRAQNDIGIGCPDPIADEITAATRDEISRQWTLRKLCEFVYDNIDEFYLLVDQYLAESHYTASFIFPEGFLTGALNISTRDEVTEEVEHDNVSDDDDATTWIPFSPDSVSSQAFLSAFAAEDIPFPVETFKEDNSEMNGTSSSLGSDSDDSDYTRSQDWDLKLPSRE